MPTLFAIPKPFKGHIAVIQHNAIRSWAKLGSEYRVILFGDEEGTAEAAKSIGATHLTQVARNEYGTPLLNDIFNQAQNLSHDRLLCYVNADIVLMNDFSNAAYRLAKLKRRFLMVGQRWDFDQTQAIDFESNWETPLRERVSRQGKLRDPTGIDYFLFTRGSVGKDTPVCCGADRF